MEDKLHPPPSTAGATPYFEHRQAGYDQPAPPGGQAIQPSCPPPPYDNTQPLGVSQAAGYAAGPSQSSYFGARQAGYDQRPVMVQQPASPPVNVTNVSTVVVQNGGNCPYCQTGVIVNETDACAWVFGVILAILFFPIGLLCCMCLLMATEQRCTHCRRTF